MTDKDKYEKILEEATEWFVLMRAEEISDMRAEKFTAWMQQSERHVLAYLELAGFWDGLLETTSKDNVIAFDLPRAKNNNVKSWFDGSAFKSVAASIIAVFVIGYSYSPLWFMDHYSTKVGEISNVILSDGSHLVMNTGSEFYADMQDDKRIIYLKKGEVFFEVARDEARPFYVETDGGLVKVLGTKFNIKDKGDYSDVTVIEGLVSVTDNMKFDETPFVSYPKYELSKDQKFTLGNNQLSNEIHKVDSRHVISWRSRQLIYNGENFEDLVKDLNRYYKVKIRIGDPNLKKIKVVAILKIEDQESTLKALSKTFNLTTDYMNGDIIYLYSQNK
jgi:transmembrane sensor